MVEWRNEWDEHVSTMTGESRLAKIVRGGRPSMEAKEYGMTHYSEQAVN